MVRKTHGLVPSPVQMQNADMSGFEMEKTKIASDGEVSSGNLRARLQFAYGIRHAIGITTDILAFLLAFFAALLLAGLINDLMLEPAFASGIAETFDRRGVQFAILTGFAITIFFALGHYRLPLPSWTSYRHIVAVCALMLLAEGFLVYASKYHLSRLWLVNSWLLAALTVPLGRAIARRILDQLGVWRIPSLVIGTGDLAAHVRKVFTADPTLGYAIIDIIDPSKMQSPQEGQFWGQLCQKRGARFIILALSAQEMVTYGDLLSDLVRERLPFAVIPSLGGLPILGFDQLSFIGRDFMMLVARNNLGQPLRRLVKLSFDMVTASLMMIACIPLFLVFALLICRDGGPLLFRHQRVGRNGVLFNCLKFRTMAPDAEQILERHLLACPEAAEEWKQNFKLRDDPRITPVGHFLRSTSLDELPQLVNVLRGEMSLVGPRPITTEELPYYGRDVMFYLETRPGITGLWQVSGRSDTSYEQRVMFDTWYAKNWALWHDIAILVKTIPVVFGRKGAV
jgi:Undecaprenyl-phosphate galactose phosphotransferase WbaP